METGQSAAFREVDIQMAQKKSEIEKLMDQCKEIVSEQGKLGIQFVQVEHQINLLTKRVDSLDENFKHYLPRSDFDRHFEDVNARLDKVHDSIEEIRYFIMEKKTIKIIWGKLRSGTYAGLALLVALVSIDGLRAWIERGFH